MFINWIVLEFFKESGVLGNILNLLISVCFTVLIEHVLKVYTLPNNLFHTGCSFLINQLYKQYIFKVLIRILYLFTNLKKALSGAIPGL